MNLELNMLSEMVKIRTIEDLIAKDYLENKIFSFLHLSIGQESSAVGVCYALTTSDLAFGNHRSHHHYIAKGGDLSKMLFEIYGDERGCCKGFGGSMHMLDREVGFVGSTPILGSVAPIGCGIAFSLKHNLKENIAVIFIGDGAAEEGAFYESINLASVLKLPILFVIEDNKYSVNSSAKDRKSENYSHSNIIKGFGCDYENIPGNDVTNVYKKTLSIKEKMLKKQSPCVLHIEVTRGVYGHSGPLKENNPYYRDENSINDIDEKDCIKHLINYLKDQKVEDIEINNLISSTIEEANSNFNNIRKQINLR
jgi:pyruvate dehydrogenase E1 component alpha subunit